MAAFALLFHSLYYNVGVRNLIDLGVMAADSERILHGQVFGRDFIAPYGPGRYYLIAGWFSLFQPSLAALCGLFVLLRILVDTGTYLLARKILPPWPALAAVLCTAFLHGPTHKGFLTAGLVAVLLAFARILDRPLARTAFLAGAGMGGAALFRYDLLPLGLLLAALALLFGPAKNGERRIFCRSASFLAGVLIGFLPALAFWSALGPGKFLTFELLRASALTKAHTPGLDLQSSLLAWNQPASGLLSLLLLLAPPLVLLARVLGRFRGIGAEAKGRRLLEIGIALAGIALFSQYALESKVNRLLQVGPPLFLCLALAAHGAGKVFGASPLRGIFLFLMIGLAGWYGYADSGKGSIDSCAVLRYPQVQVKGERAGFYTTPKIALGLKEVLGWIERQGGRKPFHAAPSVPLLYFLSGVLNPTPITDFAYLLENQDARRWMLRAMRETELYFFVNKPALVQGFDLEREMRFLTAGLRIRFPHEISLPDGYRIYTD